MRKRNHNFVDLGSSADVVTRHGPDGQDFEPPTGENDFLVLHTRPDRPWHQISLPSISAPIFLPLVKAARLWLWSPTPSADANSAENYTCATPTCLLCYVSRWPLHLPLRLFTEFPFISHYASKFVQHRKSFFFINLRITFCLTFFTATLPPTLPHRNTPLNIRVTWPVWL